MIHLPYKEINEPHLKPVVDTGAIKCLFVPELTRNLLRTNLTRT